jgi:predicted DNA-binding WGR domain protein
MDLDQPHCLERINRSTNMARYYAASVQPTLFGDSALVREWGRIGAKKGQRRLDLYPSVAIAQMELEKLIDTKQRRGYRHRAPS